MLKRLSIISLVASAVLFAIAPAFMPADYDWISQSISESGAQQLDGAWVTRLGFILFGVGALLVTAIRHAVWRAAATTLIAAFGVLMLAVAAFSTKQWDVNASYNALESNLHSISAMLMGFCIGIGVFIVVLLDKTAPISVRVLGWATVFASIAMPILAGVEPTHAGIYQRLMFAVTIAWFITQAVRAPRTRAVDERL